MSNLNRVTRMSPSSISALESCPKSWWKNRVEGVPQPAGTAGAFGNAFGHGLQKRLGCACDPTSPSAAGYDQPITDPEALKAIEWYLKQPGAWQPKPGLLAEVPVSVSPDRWADLCRHLDLAPPLWRIPIIGYLDLVDPSLRSIGCGFLETKTSKRTEFRDYYAPQSYFYLAALGLADFANPPLHADLHLLVRLKGGFKFGQWRLEASTENIRWMAERYNTALNYAYTILSAETPPPLPCKPGPFCGWCSEELTCHGPRAINPINLDGLAMSTLPAISNS